MSWLWAVAYFMYSNTSLKRTKKDPLRGYNDNGWVLCVLVPASLNIPPSLASLDYLRLQDFPTV